MKPSAMVTIMKHQCHRYNQFQTEEHKLITMDGYLQVGSLMISILLYIKHCSKCMNYYIYVGSASSAASIISTADLGKTVQSDIMCCGVIYLIFLHAAQPNLGNLTVIIWTNKEGKQEYFHLQELLCDKWILIGALTFHLYNIVCMHIIPYYSW